MFDLLFVVHIVLAIAILIFSNRLARKTNQKLFQLKRDDLGIKEYKKLYVEVLNNTYYFYTADSNTFVAQGKTLEDAAKHFTLNKGPDSLGFFNHIDSKTYCFVNGMHMEIFNA